MESTREQVVRIGSGPRRIGAPEWCIWIVVYDQSAWQLLVKKLAIRIVGKCCSIGCLGWADSRYGTEVSAASLCNGCGSECTLQHQKTAHAADITRVARIEEAGGVRVEVLIGGISNAETH